MPRRPHGARGSNQYQTRGKPVVTGPRLPRISPPGSKADLRASVLRNPDLCSPLAMTEVLNHSHVHHDLAAVLSNPRCPPAAVMSRIEQGEGDVDGKLTATMAATIASLYDPAQTAVHAANMQRVTHELDAERLGVEYLRNALTTPDVLLELDHHLLAAMGGHEHLVDRMFAAHGNCPPTVLARIAHDDSLALDVAQHPRCSEATLLYLASHVAQIVRLVVARNPAATERPLLRLAGDASYEVQSTVLGRENCPTGVLDALCTSRYRQIRNQAVIQPGASDQAKVAAAFMAG